MDERDRVSATSPLEMRAFRVLFVLAAAYNAAFAAWSVLFPRAFFEVFDLPAPRYPSIWACLGMVVGLYGIVYAHVARTPQHGDVFVWIGLAGKVFGPFGWLHAVAAGELPPRTFPLILANDLVWWFPFLFYLLRRLPRRGTIIAWVGVFVHVYACAGLLLVRGGTESEPHMAARASWVAGWPVLWTVTWLTWTVASMSLLAFFVVWSQKLVELGASRLLVTAGCLACAVGLVFDLVTESGNIIWLTQPGISIEEFSRAARRCAILGAATANGLYCVGGLVLSVIAWQVGLLRGWLGTLGFAMWIVGLGLTASTVIDYRDGMMLTGGAVMVLFVPWAACAGWRFS